MPARTRVKQWSMKHLLLLGNMYVTVMPTGWLCPSQNEQFHQAEQVCLGLC